MRDGAGPSTKKGDEKYTDCRLIDADDLKDMRDQALAAITLEQERNFYRSESVKHQRMSQERLDRAEKAERVLLAVCNGDPLRMAEVMKEKYDE